MFSFHFTRSEKILYFLSVTIVFVSFALSEFSDIVTFLSSLIGVTALLFLAKGHIFGQILTLFFALIYGVISYQFGYYGETVTCCLLTAPAALVSLVSWSRHIHSKSGEVQISRLSRKKILFLSLSDFFITILFYWILKACGTANLVVSTFSIATSFAAASLIALRSPFYALAYAVNDFVLILLWFLAGQYDRSYLPMIACFCLFLVNDVYGFFSWRRRQTRQNSD
jgi:nicotinamide mononucleotide transporter PnuC